MNPDAATARRESHTTAASPSRVLDLDARIALAEQAVIARDERIRLRGAVIVDRVQNGVLRHAGVGVAAVAGGLLLTWLFGRQGADRSRPGPWAGAAREAGFSLAGLLPLVWPFMPRKVRKHVTPGMASTLLAFAAPLLSWVLGSRRRPRDPSQR